MPTLAAPLESLRVWPDLAPGETNAFAGRILPARPAENPPATRITEITSPSLDVFLPPLERRQGTAVLICPGGAYRYVVVDKEGAEAAQWFNRLGVAAFVLRYRTRNDSDEDMWRRPLQDAQRALRLVRMRAPEWQLSSDRVGIMGFSAGGQLAALASTQFATDSYEPRDAVDGISARPDFALLMYPWNLVEAGENRLREWIPVTKRTPPAFLVHAHDDRSSAASSVQYYLALLRSEVDAELHVFRRGGHGYGLREVAGANVHTWPALAEAWLIGQSFASPSF